MAELQAGEVAISKTEYDNLLKQNAKVETLEKKIGSLEEETRNKSIALDEARTKSKDEKAELKKDLKEKEDYINSLGEKLKLGENEKIEDKLDNLITSGEKYSEILKKEEKQRKKDIEEYKKLLGGEFIKEKESLFENLDDKKTEVLLKEFVESKGLKKEEENPKVDVHKDGRDPDGKKTDFDKAYESGASSEELLNNM